MEDLYHTDATLEYYMYLVCDVIFVMSQSVTYVLLFLSPLHTSSYLSRSLLLPLHLSSLHVIKHSCGMGIALSVPILLFSSLSIFRAVSSASCKSLVT